MEYISAREAAARWDVHIRVVQNLCKAGRVAGARKYGNVWMLPSNAQKPDDPRRERKQAGTRRPEYNGSGLLTMASVSMPTGAPVLPENLGEPEQRQQIMLEFAFLRGNLAAAARAFELTGRGSGMSLCAVTLTMAAASRTDDWQRFCEADEFSDSVYRAGSERDRKLAEVALSTALLSQFATELAPPWILNGNFSYVPVEARPMSVYLYAKSLQARKHSNEIIGVCKTARALWARDESFTMLDVYLSLLLAAACRAKDDAAGCRRALDQAAEMAIPYGFIAPFAEYRQLMPEEMDEVLRAWKPALVGPVHELGEQIWENWNRFHTRFIRNHMEHLLTPPERRASYLVAKGASYRDAAQEMGLAVAEVKLLLASVYKKLYISDRADLARFML